MYPITLLGRTYNEVDFNTPGYEAKIKQFLEDCAAFLSGKQYGTPLSSHHCAFFSGSYDPAVSSASFNGSVGGARLAVGMQVIVASLLTEKLGYGVITSASTVSNVNGIVTKNFTVQVTHRYNTNFGTPSSGWLIMPGPLPSVVSDSILGPDYGGSGKNNVGELMQVLGTPVPSLNKATYFEDFDGISQSTDSSSYLTVQEDGKLPCGVYAPCKAGGKVRFSCPSELFSFMGGNTVGVCNLEVRSVGDIAVIASSDSLVSYPMRDSEFSCRFILCPSNQQSTLETFSLFAGLFDYGSVTPNIPNLVESLVYPTGILLDRQFSSELRARREFNSSSVNWTMTPLLENFCWYKLKVTNSSNTFYVSLENERTGASVQSSSLGTTSFTNSQNLCTPYVKLVKTGGTSKVDVLVDYFHWRLPGERDGLPD